MMRRAISLCSNRPSCSARRFAGDERAVAAVEFAMIFPVMALLYLGGTDLTQVIGIDRKVSLAARVAADLVAREKASVSDATLTTVCKGTAAMLAPYSTASLNITISSIVTDTKGKSTIAWSRKFSNGNCTANTADHVAKSTVTPPTGIAVNGSSLIWSEVSYQYDSMFDIVIKSGIMDLKESSYMAPRLQNAVCYNTTCS